MKAMTTFRFAVSIASIALTVSLAAAQEPAASQSTLTLGQALKLAKERNGDIRAAMYDLRGARAGVDAAKAEFFPNITPSYTYNSGRREVLAPGGTVFTQSEGGSSQINATLRVLDLGERGYSLKSSQKSAASQQASSLQTLRQVLFQVHSQYYDTLRGQELVRAAHSQVERAQSIYDATKAQVDVGQLAKKDLFQAQADLANARVQEFSAQNQLTNAQANLKATIGWQSTQPLPALIASTPPTEGPSLPSLDSLVQQGLRDRADIIAVRRRSEGLRYSALRAGREATASLGLDASFTQEMTPNSLEDRALVLNVSLPWLDFGRKRASAREASASYEASKSALTQSERNAQSEIEAAYKDVEQNSQRLTAAQEAIDAARQNYDASAESQRLGVSTIVDVITAQASLATAESNYVQALYDYETSLVQLKLVTGQPIPGEEPAT